MAGGGGSLAFAAFPLDRHELGLNFITWGGWRFGHGEIKVSGVNIVNNGVGFEVQ